jgi:ABC-type bacteriocin/lantibiotic exporter with double-glycine peptidase domain
MFLSLAALIMSFLITLPGCAENAQSTAPGFLKPVGFGKVEAVHFFPQLAYKCGPASLAGVLNFHGEAVTPAEVERAIFRDNIRGTVTLDMVLYAREKGFPAKWYSGSTHDIQLAVDAGIPLIVMVDLGFAKISRYHYMVAIGYSPEGVIANSGKDHEKLIRWEWFLPRWQKTKRWTLRIEP